LRYECVGLKKIFDKSDKTVLRSCDEPGCALRIHYEIKEVGHRLTLKPCRCLSVKLTKWNNLAENKRYNLEAYLSGRKKAA
jgi:hypothetical protein